MHVLSSQTSLLQCQLHLLLAVYLLLGMLFNMGRSTHSVRVVQWTCVSHIMNTQYVLVIVIIIIITTVIVIASNRK